MSSRICNLKFLKDEVGRQMIGNWLARASISSERYDGTPWFCNCLFEADWPYLWRSNGRIRRESLVGRLRIALGRLDFPFPALLFHEGLGGWRRLRGDDVTRFAMVESPDGLTHLLSRHAWNLGRELGTHLRSDNYNLLSADGGMALVVSHENEMLFFAHDHRSLAWALRAFRLARLSVHVEPVGLFSGDGAT